MREMYAANKKKILIILIFSIFMGLFVEFFSIFNIDTYKKIRIYSDWNHTVSIDGMEMINCRKQEQGHIITSNNDAQLLIRDVNAYVGYAEVRLNKPAEHAWQLQIFYSTDESGFHNDKVITQWVSKYEKRVLIEVEQEVLDFRIDLGDEPDTEFELRSVIVNPFVHDYVGTVFDHISGIKILVYVILIFLLGLCSIDVSAVLGSAYRHRWILGTLIILFCTLFKIHGSSINFYTDVLPGYDYEELWGRYRGIRSDEFIVSTPMTLAQVKGGFQWFSDFYRYSPTDMFVVGGQPVKDLFMILYRPFQVGYLLFGAERGLAFYWSARIVCCFLASFEFGQILTHNNKKLSVAYALLVFMAPVVQWFFSAGGLIEILVFGQMAILLLKKYINSIYIKSRIACMAGLVICAGGYVVSLYPAYQIPFFYVFLVCAAAFLIENRKNVKFGKSDALLWILGIGFLAISMVYIICKSSGAIETMMNTVYPGSRNILGGEISDLVKLFEGWSSIFWSVIDIDNPCEASSFVDFFPLGIILAVSVFLFQKKRDCWIFVLSILNLVMISFVAFQWPYLLAKVTLFNNVPVQRMIVPVGLLNLILLVRCMAIGNFKKSSRFFIQVILIIVICGLSFYSAGNYLDSILRGLILCCVFCTVTVIVNTAEKRNGLFLCLCIIISTIGGGLVNPVNRGLDVLYDNPLIRNMERINDDKQGMWIVDTDFFVYNNLPAVVGAQAVNSVQVYPDRSMWERLGLESQEDIWNRYAHVNLRITSEKGIKNNLELQQSDSIKLNIGIESVRKLGVRYILSNQDMKQTAGLDCLYEFGGFYIYEIK